MSLKPFEIDQAKLGSGIHILTLTGTMTMGEQLQTLEGTVRGLAQVQGARVVIDMAGIGYIDSSALGVLVSCHSILKKAGGQLRLSGLIERVSRIIHLGGADGVLVIDSTKDAAVAAFA